MEIININSENNSLTGYEQGKRDFNKYIAKVLKDNSLDNITISFASNIEAISISYTQGFTNKLVKQYGKDYVINHLHIVASNDNLVNRFKKAIII